MNIVLEERIVAIFVARIDWASHNGHRPFGKIFSPYFCFHQEDYPIKDVCKLMSVSRAGYYKWLKHVPSNRDLHREEIVEKVKEVHEKHKTYGYRWTAAYIRINIYT